jgi:hypothetical protein
MCRRVAQVLLKSLLRVEGAIALVAVKRDRVCRRVSQVLPECPFCVEGTITIFADSGHGGML